MSPDLSRLTVSQLSDLIRKNACSPKVLLESLEKNITERDSDPRHIHAYVPGRPRHAIQRKADPNSPLRGVPIAIKDNICVEGLEVTCASKILKNFVSPYHATVIEKLLDAGAVVYGQTNMDEFAFGSSCETSCYGPTRNPRDPERVPGGSSGGSAAAVADHTAYAALGSDTGGSIRQPAAFCGVVGMKPTYGRVSRYGLIAFASSLDQIGPITKDVRDNAILLKAIAGHDPNDSTSVNRHVPNYQEFLGKSLKGKKILVPYYFFDSDSSSDTRDLVMEAAKVLENLGAKVTVLGGSQTVTKDYFYYTWNYSVAVYYIIAPAEASSNLARFDGVRFGSRDLQAKTLLEMFEKTRGVGFGSEAKRRIILGTFSLSSGYYDAYYLKAMKVRTKIKEEFDRQLENYDAILTATAPSPAFKIGQKINNPLEMYLSDIYTIPVNLAGVPAISLPGGITNQNLPLGIQLIGKAFDEENLYQIAYAFEQETRWHKKLYNVRE